METWQEKATPNLTGPSGSAPSSGGGAGTEGAAPDLSGPTIASRRSSGGERGASESAGEGRAGSNWWAEARRFAGRARAPSNQLGQMAARDPGGRSSSDKAASSEQASAKGTSAASADSPPLPAEPTVPIDDHLHWLLVAGVLWGVWQLWRG